MTRPLLPARQSFLLHSEIQPSDSFSCRRGCVVQTRFVLHASTRPSNILCIPFSHSLKSMNHVCLSQSPIEASPNLYVIIFESFPYSLPLTVLTTPCLSSYMSSYLRVSLIPYPSPFSPHPASHPPLHEDSCWSWASWGFGGVLVWASWGLGSICVCGWFVGVGSGWALWMVAFVADFCGGLVLGPLGGSRCVG